VQIDFDPAQVSYAALIQFFYRMHDPTTLNRQGMDTGTQYRSGIFYHDEDQKSVAEEITRMVGEQWWKGKSITTQILPAGEWWDAEVGFAPGPLWGRGGGRC
jgi:peptide-methionine (S)-S-oxide reductase